MLGKPNGSIGKWGRVVRVNDGDPAQLIDQLSTGRLAEWRQNGTAKAYLDNSGNLTAAGLAAIVASQATGDILYASSATAMARLGIGATDDFLTIQGGLPVWSKAFDPVFIIGGNNTTDRVLTLRKTRNTVASPDIIVTGDLLGEVSFEGYDGGEYEQAAVMRVTSEGTIGAGRVPAKWSLLVNTDADPSVLTERLSINSAGLITLPTATAKASGLGLGTLNFLYANGSGQGFILSSTVTPRLDIGAVNASSTGGSTLNMLGAPNQAVKEIFSLSAGNDVTMCSGPNGFPKFATGLAIDPASGITLKLNGGANGQVLNHQVLTELTNIAAAAFTDTTIQIPADAVVDAVSYYVSVQPPGTATADVGVAGATTRYGTGLSTAATTASPGTVDASRYYAAAVSIRITPNGVPSDTTGRIRIVIYYHTATPPTS